MKPGDVVFRVVENQYEEPAIEKGMVADYCGASVVLSDPAGRWSVDSAGLLDRWHPALEAAVAAALTEFDLRCVRRRKRYTDLLEASS